jgi:pyruvate dehydrogenase E2 component (dihydrolipoamide acetyltransferase)
MLSSAQSTAPVTLTTTADATNLVIVRNKLQTSGGSGPLNIVPSYTDVFIKLTAAALERHPRLNSCWYEDGILQPEEIHIAIGVDTEAGLVAPVARNVCRLSLEQLAAETRALIEQARSGQLTLEQLEGGTFTVTNLGMYGIDTFTPIIHLPQCAVLGIGRIVRQPAVYQDQIVPRDMVSLSLTFDHRVVDGAPAARFLDTIRSYIEEPPPWLVA